MERTTGYSLAITGVMQARRQFAGPGVHTPDEAIPPELYIAELAKRGINIRQPADPSSRGQHRAKRTRSSE
jgi:hypothetical protein